MNDLDKIVFRDMLKKLIIITLYQQKDVRQVVINLIKTILINM